MIFLAHPPCMGCVSFFLKFLTESINFSLSTPSPVVLVHPFMYLFIHSSLHPSIHSFMYPSIPPSIHPLPTQPPIYSFILLYNYQETLGKFDFFLINAFLLIKVLKNAQDIFFLFIKGRECLPGCSWVKWLIHFQIYPFHGNLLILILRHQQVGRWGSRKLIFSQLFKLRNNFFFICMQSEPELKCV